MENTHKTEKSDVLIFLAPQDDVDGKCFHDNDDNDDDDVMMRPPLSTKPPKSTK